MMPENAHQPTKQTQNKIDEKRYVIHEEREV
jgi:hypothetical protein